MAKDIKVNIGAGHERLEGWTSLDLPPVGQEEFIQDPSKQDIYADAFRLPFADNSVSNLRMKDFLIEWDLEAHKEIGQEVSRVLKPGGTFTSIEHRGFVKSFEPYLKRVSTNKGEKVPYTQKSHFWVTTYKKAK